MRTSRDDSRRDVGDTKSEDSKGSRSSSEGAASETFSLKRCVGGGVKENARDSTRGRKRGISKWEISGPNFQRDKKKWTAIPKNRDRCRSDGKYDRSRAPISITSVLYGRLSGDTRCEV